MTKAGLDVILTDAEHAAATGSTLRGFSKTWVH